MEQSYEAWALGGHAGVVVNDNSQRVVRAAI